MKVWHIKDVLKDRVYPSPFGKHPNIKAASTYSRDGAVVTKDNLCMPRQESEMREPCLVQAHCL